MTALRYICNDSKRFPRFVSNKVSYIRSKTTSSDWKHVPTEMNIADCASRGLSSEDFLAKSEWSTGPRFLYENEVSWPKRSIDTNSLDGLELKSLATNCTNECENPTEKLLLYHSSWYKTKRLVAHFLKFIE